MKKKRGTSKKQSIWKKHNKSRSMDRRRKQRKKERNKGRKYI
jgi:hypothetical protein